MNLRVVLTEIGADDSELDHLVGCDDCRVEGDIEGATIWRCALNPVAIAEEAEMLSHREGWALLRFMGAHPNPFPFLGVGDYLETMMSEHARMLESRLIRQMQAPWMPR